MYIIACNTIEIIKLPGTEQQQKYISETQTTREFKHDVNKSRIINCFPLFNPKKRRKEQEHKIVSNTRLIRGNIVKTQKLYMHTKVPQHERKAVSNYYKLRKASS